MMTRRIFPTLFSRAGCASAIVGAALLLSFAGTASAWPPGGNGGGPGGGGGGAGGGGAAYTIVDLPGPYHDADGGYSRTFAEHISNVAAGVRVFVLGRYEVAVGSPQPCVWTVDAAGVSVADLTGLLDKYSSSPSDMNSAGIISGQKDGHAALLFPGGQVVLLSSGPGVVSALNDPDDEGVFQAIGGFDLTPYVWDVDVNGNVLATTPLVDPNGQSLRADDVNEFAEFGGGIVVYGQGLTSPAVFSFDADGELQISLRANPNPAEIDGFRAFQIDDAGDLLGFGYQSSATGGEYSRAVIWPADGGAIDLGAETGIRTTEGNGIALVNGKMQAVGRADGDHTDAFAYLYTNGTLSDLGPMSKGDQPWDFDRAEGVNTAGMICGVGYVGSRKNRQLHGFLLLPNEP
jgi:hypothetical protein